MDKRYLVSKIVPTLSEKKKYCYFEKNVWNSRLKAKIFFFLHKANTILGKKCFLTYSWRVLTSNKSEQLEFKLQRNNWDLETERKKSGYDYF